MFGKPIATEAAATPATVKKFLRVISVMGMLGGLEPGKNRYGKVDSTWRYIYIHGRPDEIFNGKPKSHGCIRMKNADILNLLNQVTVGIKVYIHE